MTRILVVDDDAALRAYLVDVLGAMPHVDVVSVASGEEAVGRLEREWFDVVITGQRMGRVDGVHVLEAAARLQPGAPRVLVTGHADLSLTEDAVNKGHVTRLLPKPFLPADLTTLVQPLLHERRDGVAREAAFARAVNAAPTA